MGVENKTHRAFQNMRQDTLEMQAGKDPGEIAANDAVTAGDYILRLLGQRQPD